MKPVGVRHLLVGSGSGAHCMVRIRPAGKRTGRAAVDLRSCRPRSKYGARTQAGSADPSPLTSQEEQIAGMLAERLSKKEIADRLVISPRTDETHVASNLGKLGLTSRAQITVWMTERRPASASPGGDKTR